MAYNEKINLKLYKYENSQFVLQAIIDDFQEISFNDNLYEAGDFSITINYNIPNALKFQRGMFVQFGDNEYRFGEIFSISDAIGEDGKGSQTRTIIGKDARFIFKRRIIKNLNNEENWIMTAKGEICLRSLVDSQCGSSVETKRQLPITNIIPTSENAIGDEYSVAESFTNLYDTLVTIATQSKIGWRVAFKNNSLVLECYEGTDRSSSVQFSTDFDSLSNGEFTDSSESYANSIYIGGKGTGNDRDIYEGEQEIDGESPAGLERYEAWDNQSNMTSESEYEAEALSMLTQYGQTLTLSGQGLAKCPYRYREQYFVGDTIKVAFSGKSANVQILSVTEHWSGRGQYGIEFSFGKPQNDFSRQLQLILKQIQKASNKTTSTSSVKWYTIPTDTAMAKSEVIYDTIGFIGECAENGSTFQLYWDSEKTGAKTYHVYFKQLAGGKLTLTTGVSGATNLILNSGTYVAIIYVDSEGNVTSQGATATNVIESGNTQPATSGGVADAISSAIGTNPDVTNATGVLPIAHGGTGKTTAQDACNELINGLSTGDSVPVDDDYTITQYVNGGTTTKTYHRRKMIRIWEYIKSKIYDILNIKAPSDSGVKLTSFSASLGANSTYRKSYLLICDITALDGVSRGGSSYGFVGQMFAHRTSGYLREHSSECKITASYNESNSLGNSLQLYTSDTSYVPVKVHNESTNKTYLAIRYSYGAETNCTFVGVSQNLPSRGYVSTIHVDVTTNKDSSGVTWTEKCVGLTGLLNMESSSTANNTAITANKIRTSAPSSPANGDIWIS